MTHETITTTLAEIRSHRPCEGGFAKIRDHFGVSPADAKTHDKSFPVSLLLETNGLDDCLWVTAHVAPDAATRFLIKVLDTGDYSALKTLRQLDGDFSEQVSAVENVVVLLRRTLTGEDVERDLREAYAAADAAYAAYAAADSADAAYAAYAVDAAYAAANAAAYAARAVDAARAAHAAAYAARAVDAAHAAYAARVAAKNDLKEILG